jgi:hypothetical protein
VPGDVTKLRYDAEPTPAATFTGDFKTVLSITDFGVGGACDTALTEPQFQPMVEAIINKALFDADIRKAWPATKVAYMWGQDNAWNVAFGVWDVEKRVNDAKGKAPIAFRPIPGANHFVRRLSFTLFTLLTRDTPVDVGGWQEGAD